MKTFLKNNIFIFLILLIGTIVRLYQIDKYPALNADEAALGYNAYSLIQTGKDEHGNPWPINFQSFNDFKPGLYVYLLLPLIKFFGLNIFATRLPGVIFSVLSIFVIYRLSSKLTNDTKIPLISSIILATSPWHILFSRGAWEVNLATFLIALGIYLLIIWEKSNKPSTLIASGIVFSLGLYSYQSARIIVPLLLFGYAVFKRSILIKYPKQIISAVAISGLILLPLVLDFTKPDRLARASGVGILADQGPLWAVNEARGEHSNIYISKVFHNLPVYYSIEFIQNYFEHYDLNFLFLNGDVIQRSKVPRTGQMLIVLLPFFVLGLIISIKNINTWKLILWWFVISPVAAAMTFQSPHALRSENMVIPLSIIISIGLSKIFNSNNFSKTVKILLILIFVWNFTLFLREYFIHTSKTFPFSSQYGIKELVEYVKNQRSEKTKIIITDRYDQPYILFLYYLAYSPEKFQKEHVLTEPDKFGFSTVRHFDKYYFQSINWQDIRDKEHGAVIIGTQEEIPQDTNIVKTISFPNGEPAFIIVDN